MFGKRAFVILSRAVIFSLSLLGLTAPAWAAPFSASCGLDSISLETSINVDWEHPWPAGTPFPKFIQSHYIDLKYLESISKFRSGAGHIYSDEFEAPDRSMKHHFAPLPQYRLDKGSNHDIQVFSPVTGTISDIFQESHQLSNGEYAGYQMHIIPEGYPQFKVRLFHVNYLSSLIVGTHVSAGQWLGYADMREAHDSDVAVECIYGAPPLHPFGSPYNDRGDKYLSAFDVMTDALFRQYQTRGLAQRSDAIISKEYRDANPVTDWSIYHPEDWIYLKKQPQFNSVLLLLTD